MPAKKVPLLCFVLIAAGLSACSSTRHSQKHTTHKERKQKHKPKSATQNSELTFLDNISTPKNGQNTSHKVNAYHSAPSSTDKHLSIGKFQKEYSKYLDINPQKVIYDPKLWSFIDQWWGTPYRFGGSTKRGIDCSAFSQILYRKVFGDALPRTARAQYKNAVKIKHTKNLEPGDLVFFKIHRRYISHVGIYLQNDKFVSATSSAGVTISDLNDPYWSRYFVGGGRPRK